MNLSNKETMISDVYACKVSCLSSAQSCTGCMDHCQSSCQKSCQNCQSTCQKACQNCQGVACQSCQSACQKSCQSACQKGCQSTCELSCQNCEGAACENCQTTCEKACQSCQGVACQSCQSTCEKACQNCQGVACQSCQSTCEKACQNCQGVACQSCQSTCLKSCQSTCQNYCQSTCQQTCQTTCQKGCQSTCEKACQNCQGVACQSCQSTCEKACQNCEGVACQSCQSICELNCQNCEGAVCENCQTTCEKACQNCEGTACQNCECETQNTQGTTPSPGSTEISTTELYRILPNDRTGLYLNISGYGTSISNNNIVNLFDLDSRAYEQKWEFKKVVYNSETCYSINSNLVNSFNLHNKNNSCVVYEDTLDSEKAIKLIPIPNKDNVYKIMHIDSNLYLTASGNNVAWNIASTSNQEWKIEIIEKHPNPLFRETSFPIDVVRSSYSKAKVYTEDGVVYHEIENVNESYNQRNTDIVAFSDNLRRACTAFAYANLMSFYTDEEIKPWWLVFGSSGHLPNVMWHTSKKRVARDLPNMSTAETYDSPDKYYPAIKQYIDKGQPVLLHCGDHWTLAYKYKGNCENNKEVYVKDSIRTDENQENKIRGDSNLLYDSMRWSSGSYDINAIYKFKLYFDNCNNENNPPTSNQCDKTMSQLPSNPNPPASEM